MHNGTGNGDCNSDSADQISLSKVKTEILDEDPDLQDFYGVLGSYFIRKWLLLLYVKYTQYICVYIYIYIYVYRYQLYI